MTPTSVNITCTGTYEVFTDCVGDFTSTTVGTRTGDSYVVNATVMIDFNGTGLGCDLVPDQCISVVTRGSRVGPEPTAYCGMVQTLESSWGKLKATYR